jgi:hypothetical protein
MNRISTHRLALIRTNHKCTKWNDAEREIVETVDIHLYSHTRPPKYREQLLFVRKCVFLCVCVFGKELTNALAWEKLVYSYK